MPVPQDRPDIVFDGPPGPECGRFVEVENERGESFGLGKWVERDDGYWVIRFTPRDAAPELYEALAAFVYEATHLSPQEDDGSHMARITGTVLASARAALSKALGERP